MKKIIFTMLAAALCLASCMEEKGNYNYEHASLWYPADLTPESIGKTHMVTLGETLTIEPAFAKAGVRESDYDYLWYIERDGKRDSISRTLKLLDYKVMTRTGDQKLWLKVTNKANGISRTYNTTMRVVTDFSDGWFITKEVEGGMTDVDIVKYAKPLHIANSIATLNGQSLEGTPVRSALDAVMEGQNSLAGWEYIDEEGNTKIENMLFVLTSKQVRPFRVDYMSEGVDMDHLFVELPDVVNPQDFGCFCHDYCDYDIMINNNKLHWGVGFTPQSNRGFDGQISEVIFRQLRVNPSICKVMPTGYDGYQEHASVLLFDEESRSFKLLVAKFPAPGAPLKVKDLSAVLDPAFNLEWMMEVNGSAGLGLLKKDDGSYWAFNTKKLAQPFYLYSTLMGSVFDGQPRRIPDGSVVSTAKVRTAHSTDLTVFCSAGDNEVYAFQTGTCDEQKILTLPADEQVSFIRDISNKDNQTDFHHLVVLSNNAAGWKLRCYDFVPGTAALAGDTPVKEYSGTGRAVHTLYRGLELGQHCF